MLYRQRLPLQAIYTHNQTAYQFAGLGWQHILYDRAINEHLDLEPVIYLGYSTNETITEVGTKRFIYPFPMESFAKFEGEAFGNVRVKVWSNDVSIYGELDRIKVTLKTLDPYSNERLLTEYAFDATCQGTSANETPLPDDLVAPGFLFFFPIDESKEDHERLIFDITAYGHVSNSSKIAFFELYSEKNKKDIYLNLPTL